MKQKNPFYREGLLPESEKFIGRENIIKSLKNSLIKGKNFFLYGERKIGKTSIITQYIKNYYPDIIGRRISLYIDCKNKKYLKFPEFILLLVKKILKDIKIVSGKNESNNLSKIIKDSKLESTNTLNILIDITNRLKIYNNYIDIFFDNIEYIDYQGIEFFNKLYVVYKQTNNVFFIISSRIKITCFKSKDSKFFNTFKNSIKINHFNEKEAECLVYTYITNKALFENLWKQKDRLFHMTGYHPFFLQILCYHLFIEMGNSEFSSKKSQKEILKNFKNDTNKYFELFWGDLKPEEKELMISLSFNKKYIKNLSYEELKYRSLIIQTDQKDNIFSSVFASWIKQKYPNKKLKLKIFIVTILISAGIVSCFFINNTFFKDEVTKSIEKKSTQSAISSTVKLQNKLKNTQNTKQQKNDIFLQRMK